MVPDDLPSQIEKQWLSQIEDFERQRRDAAKVSVATYLNYPKFLAEAQLSDRKLEQELLRVRGELEGAGITVDTLYDVPARALYRFITEDLLWEEIDDIKMNGINHQFVYEEFYADDRFEIEHTLVEFFDMLFGKYYSMLDSVISMDCDDSDSISRADRVDQLCDFTDAFDDIQLKKFQLNQVEIHQGQAQAELDLSFTGYPNFRGQGFTFTGKAEFTMLVDEYGYWSIKDFKIPGVPA